MQGNIPQISVHDCNEALKNARIKAKQNGESSTNMGKINNSWSWSVIVKALNSKYNLESRQNFVLRVLKGFKPKSTLSLEELKFLKDRAEKYPGTFFLFQGYVNSHTYFPRDKHDNKSQYHCNTVDITANVWYEPFISNGALNESQ